MMRAAKGAGAIRLGVVGNKSPTNSKIASAENKMTAHVEAMNARGESCRLSHPKCAAQATAAGAVSARKPATTPIPKAKARM